MIAPNPTPSKGPASSSSSTKKTTNKHASKKSASAASKKAASAASKKSASAAAAASLGSRPPAAMDAALRAYHCRKVVNNPFVAGHCYFEAQALSNSLTNGLGDKKRRSIEAFAIFSFLWWPGGDPLASSHLAW